jgi:hypothetical protein
MHMVQSSVLFNVLLNIPILDSLIFTHLGAKQISNFLVMFTFFNLASLIRNRPIRYAAAAAAYLMMMAAIHRS